MCSPWVPGLLRLASGVEPSSDLVGVEPYEPAPFEVGHPLLSDEAAHVARSDPKVLGELFDAEKTGKFFGVGHGTSWLIIGFSQ